MNFKNQLAISPHLILPFPCIWRLDVTARISVRQAMEAAAQAEQNRIFAQLQDMVARGLVQKSAVVGMLFELSKLGRHHQSVSRTH